MMPPGPDVGEIVDGTLPGADGATARVPPVPAGDRRPAPDHRVLPRRWLGARQRHVRRSAVPLPVRQLELDHRVGRLPPRSRGTLPRGGRRRPGSGDLDRRARRPSWAAHAGAIAVAGWSAGANVAAVTAQQAKLAGAPTISGQVLLCPVTDGTTTAPVLRGQRRRLRPDGVADELVLGPLLRPGRPIRSEGVAVAAEISPASPRRS